MTDDLWDKPVELMIDNSDHFHRVSNSREAVACLKTAWPAERCGAVAVARKACLMAIEGKGSREAAQSAFMKAAAKAGILRP
jgi:Protein of unknown function (DUF982)